MSGDQEAPTSHGEALKSTSIMGGSMAVGMLIRMVRTKVIALVLGPAGIGLEAIFDSVLSLIKIATIQGVSSSGVRQIAAAVSTGEEQKIATTMFTLRRVCLILGASGAVAVFLARESISRLTFGDTSHAFDIGCLAIIPLLGGIAGGQGAVLQGMRRINELAKINILGAATATLVSLPIVWVWGKEGIAAYLVLTAAIGLGISWTYVRRLNVKPISVPLHEMVHDARNLLRLGLVFVLSGLMTTGALFLLRVLVTRHAGVDGAGQFQAANALSMVYVGFVLQAMGTDFYPRLTAVADDDRRCNQLVNEQTEVAMLLALPGVLASLALAPWLIHVFYSRRFDMAAEILCWQILGMLLRVNSSPMGYIVVAKGRSLVFFLADLASYSVYAVLGWMALKVFGLPGIGMACLGLYIFHSSMMYMVVRRMSGFRWSPENVRLIFGGISIAAATLCARLMLPEPWATLIGTSFALAAGLYCLRALVRLIGVKKTNSYLEKIRIPFRFRETERPDGEASPVAST